jgi:divalent metal cation (Fe/Co/Zn/Cd) transporter
LGCVFALVLFVTIATVFRPALGEIMDEHLYDDLIESIRVVASHVEGIIDTESVSYVNQG